MDKEQIKFQISELHRDRTQFVLEALTISMLALLLFIGAPSVFPELINPYLPSSLKIMQGIIVVPVVFWLFVLIGNLLRLVKINKLTKMLSRELDTPVKKTAPKRKKK